MKDYLSNGERDPKRDAISRGLGSLWYHRPQPSSSSLVSARPSAESSGDMADFEIHGGVTTLPGDVDHLDMHGGICYPERVKSEA